MVWRSLLLVAPPLLLPPPRPASTPPLSLLSPLPYLLLTPASLSCPRLPLCSPLPCSCFSHSLTLPRSTAPPFLPHSSTPASPSQPRPCLTPRPAPVTPHSSTFSPPPKALFLSRPQPHCSLISVASFLLYSHLVTLTTPPCNSHSLIPITFTASPASPVLASSRPHFTPNSARPSSRPLLPDTPHPSPAPVSPPFRHQKCTSLNSTESRI